jgi:mannonate dehydratase
VPHSAEAYEVFRRSYTFQDGYLHPGDTPGIGVTVDKEAAARFEYRPAYLPVNRLRDGTVHDW